MQQASDSNYAALTRHRRPYSTAGRPPAMIDDEFWVVSLEDDDIWTPHVAEPVEDDAVAGNSSTAANTANERRRREEGWNDLGLDQVHRQLNTAGVSSTQQQRQPQQNNNAS